MPLSDTKYTHCLHYVQIKLHKYILRKHSTPIHSYLYVLLRNSQEQTTHNKRSDTLLYYSQIQRLLLSSEIYSVPLILHIPSPPPWSFTRVMTS